MKKVFRNVFTAAFLLLILIGCSTTKRIADDEVLYTGVKKMEIIPDSGVKIADAAASDVRSTLSVAPNNPLFSPYIRTPFPIGLWVWNYMEPKREKGLKHWIYEKLAKEPVLISTVQPELRMRVVKDILGNNGYFGAKADYELIYNKRNPKKARISYWVDLPQPFHYGSVQLWGWNPPMDSIVRSYMRFSELKPGRQYDVNVLNQERQRMSDRLRNHGYYFFQPDYIEFLVDTTQGGKMADVRIGLKQGIPQNAFHPYKIGEVKVMLSGNETTGGQDTIQADQVKIIYEPPLRLKPNVITRAVKTRPGQTYSAMRQRRTQAGFVQLGVFKFANMTITVPDTVQDRLLDMQINGDFTKKFLGAHLRDGKAIRAYADEIIKELDIRCFSAQQHTGTLSGGNQQKVCIARALAMNPKLLFVSEPTRGIDIGAKKLVLETLVRLNREKGMTVVMVSSELMELRSICDRIAIVAEGKVVDVLETNASDADFGLAMSGIKPEHVKQKGGEAHV